MTLTPAAYDREAERLSAMARRAMVAPLEQCPVGLNPHAYAARLTRQAHRYVALAHQLASRS